MVQWWVQRFPNMTVMSSNIAALHLLLRKRNNSSIIMKFSYVVSSGLLVAVSVLVVAFIGDPTAASNDPDLIADWKEDNNWRMFPKWGPR